MKLSIIIPVYNENKTFDEVLKRVRLVQLPVGVEREIIVVDDASTDGTNEKIERENEIVVISHEENLGKGISVIDGLNKASGDIIIIQDADREYDPSDYGRLIEPILKKEAEVVYGSRFLNPDVRRKMFFSQYWSNRILTLLSNLLTGLKLTDMETCYKVMNRKVVDEIKLKLRSNRFGIEPEITALVKKFKVVEVPISYYGRSREEGKKIDWKDGLAAVGHIIKNNLFR